MKVDDDDNEEDKDEDLFASKDDPFKLFGSKIAPKMVCYVITDCDRKITYIRFVSILNIDVLHIKTDL